MSPDESNEDVRHRFSAASGSYDEQAEVQAACARKLLELLGDIPEPRTILEVGCGTGQLTRLLLDRFPGARVAAIDVAPGMVREARRRLGASERVRWIVADARRHLAGRTLDLVASNSSLHWLDPMATSLQHLAGQLAPQGRLAASVMLDGTLQELHEARRLAAPEKIPRARLLDADTLRAHVETAGLEIETYTVEETVLTLPSPEVLLEAIHRQGVTGGSVSRAARPLHRGDLRRLGEIYRERFAVEGGVRVTYRVGYVRATKKGSGLFSTSALS